MVGVPPDAPGRCVTTETVPSEFSATTFPLEIVPDAIKLFDDEPFTHFVPLKWRLSPTVGDVIVTSDSDDSAWVCPIADLPATAVSSAGILAKSVLAIYPLTEEDAIGRLITGAEGVPLIVIGDDTDTEVTAPIKEASVSQSYVNTILLCPLIVPTLTYF